MASESEQSGCPYKTSTLAPRQEKVLQSEWRQEVVQSCPCNLLKAKAISSYSVNCFAMKYVSSVLSDYSAINGVQMEKKLQEWNGFVGHCARYLSRTLVQGWYVLAPANTKHSTMGSGRPSGVTQPHGGRRQQLSRVLLGLMHFHHLLGWGSSPLWSTPLYHSGRDLTNKHQLSSNQTSVSLSRCRHKASMWPFSSSGKPDLIKSGVVSLLHVSRTFSPALWEAEKNGTIWKTELYYKLDDV